jgi:hypothetical protein
MIMDTNEKPVWFAAKRYGWGWGLPCAWQGWVVFAVWLGFVCGTALLMVPGHFALWMASTAVLATALFAVCLIKGERPRWRWGEPERQPTRPLSDRLAELDDLRRKELLSESEHEAMRQKILSAFGSIRD